MNAGENINSAQKALIAKQKAMESKIADWYHEAQHYHGIFMGKLNAIIERDKQMAAIRATRKIYVPRDLPPEVEPITTEDSANLKKAIKLYEKCAKRGHADSMECLAFIYQDCPGFQDQKKMFKWYLKGAESGSLTCMHNVGVCYQDGLGVKMSYTKAQFWFEKEEQEQSNKK